jgi:hypothetical protein
MLSLAQGDASSHWDCDHCREVSHLFGAQGLALRAWAATVRCHGRPIFHAATNGFVSRSQCTKRSCSSAKPTARFTPTCPLNRNRLKRDRLVRAADQNIGTKSCANGSFRSGTHIGACEFTGAKRCRSIDEPNNDTAISRSQIKPKLGNGAAVRLGRPRHRGSESTIECLS